MAKRMFQILDEMNIADGENGTASLQVSNTLVSAQTAKGGGRVCPRLSSIVREKKKLRPGQIVGNLLEKKMSSMIVSMS